MSNYQHEADVLKCLEEMLGVIRDSRTDRISIYQLDMRADPDRIVAKTNAVLAKLFAEGKIDRELRIVHQHLHSGECVVYRENATTTPTGKAVTAGKQPCFDKIQSLLAQMAAERKFDENDGRVLGHTAEEILNMEPRDLEEFRKAVCSQRTGGIQMENKVLYYLGNNLEVGKNAGATQFVHAAIGRRFRDVSAIYKDPDARRTYNIKFEDRAVANKLAEAKKDLKNQAELAEKRRAEAAAKKLAAKKEAKKESAEETVPQEAFEKETVESK